MVEIFKTNVNNKRLAKILLNALHNHFPACSFNFDLDDCDRILRVQGEDISFAVIRIMRMVQEHSIEICLFEDQQ